MAYKRRVRPRRRRTRRPRRMRRMRIPRKIGYKGIPQRYRTCLTYVDALPASIAAASYSYWNYQSSLFDPYASVGGHQPYLFDQLATLYGYYRVYGMAYTIEAQTVTAAGHLVAVTYWNRDNSIATTISAAAERVGSKMIGFSNQYRSRMKGYKSVANMWNVSRKDVNIDDDFSAAIGSDPNKRMYLILEAFNPTTTALDVVLVVKLKYYCEFFGQATLGQS